MHCEDNILLLHSFLDDELDEDQRSEMKAHLADCPSCSHELASQRHLRSLFTAHELRFTEPTDLHQRVQAALSYRPQRKWDHGPLTARRLLIAASLLALFAGGWWAASIFNSSTPEERMALAVVSAHARSLQGQHLLDVPSSDRHQVKPWFQGKVDFSPPVKDLTDRGFNLQGGRLDYLGDRPVAALVYKKRQHVINLFLWPSTEHCLPTNTSSLRGYQLLHWAQGGLTSWAVSDLNAEELREFASLIQTTP